MAYQDLEDYEKKAADKKLRGVLAVAAGVALGGPIGGAIAVAGVVRYATADKSHTVK